MTQRLVEQIYILPKGSVESTFKYDAVLPSLPLPALEETLKKYIESVKPFVNADELAKTEALVADFQNGLGKQLHEKLTEKASKSRNWVEHWWEKYGYHSIREPLLPFCTMDGPLPYQFGFVPPDSDLQIKNGALTIFCALEFWKLIREGRLRPGKSADGKTIFSMSQFKRLFSTVRLPGVKFDHLESTFKTNEEGSTPSHFIVFSHGRIFRVESLDNDGNTLTPPEFATILKKIRTEAELRPVEKRVPVLTCDNRTTWAKNRSKLLDISAVNSETLKEIESAIFHVVLDPIAPATDSELSNCNLCGADGQKWADKSLVYIFYSNGRLGGLSEHSAFDGLASITSMYFTYLTLSDSHGGWQGRMDVRPEVVQPKELHFNINSELEKEIDRVSAESRKNSDGVIMTRNKFATFGKKEIQKCKLHPDGFVQMALQLTYFKLHRKPAPCYETATTRAFYNGRTETVRSCSAECVDFVTAMMDPRVTRDKKQRLLKTAVAKHDSLMTEARNGYGCDRHLFGLYCTALEEGLPIHQLYSDPSYSKSGGGGNFVLSTSLVGYTPCGGGVAPMTLDGYGAFYGITPTAIDITVSTFRNSKETNAQLFFSTFCDTLVEMRELMLGATQPSSKL